MRSLKARWGDAASSGCASFTWKVSSGIDVLVHRLRLLFQFGKKALHFLPDLGAAGETAPARPNQPGQAVAFINRRAVRPAIVAQAVYQQRFHIRFEFRQARIVRYQPVPDFRRRRGLRYSRGTGIQRDDFSRLRAMKEKRQPYRNPQTLPLRIARAEVGPELDTLRNLAEPGARSAAEQNHARVTRAQQLPFGRVQQMLMLRSERRAAQVAGFGCAGTRKPAQGRQRRGRLPLRI